MVGQHLLGKCLGLLVRPFEGKLAGFDLEHIAACGFENEVFGLWRDTHDRVDASLLGGGLCQRSGSHRCQKDGCEDEGSFHDGYSSCGWPNKPARRHQVPREGTISYPYGFQRMQGGM